LGFKNEKLMKAFAYIRVSTDKQTNSLEMQVDKINYFAKYKGIEIIETFTDEDVSAGKPMKKRPSGGKLIEAISNPNCEAKAIIITSLTRAFRNLVDAIATADWARKKRISIYLVDDGLEVDTATPNGFLQFGVQALIAQWERMTISKRTSDIHQSKKNRGEVYTASRYGFKNVDRVVKDGKVINPGKEVVDEKDLEGFEIMKDLHAKGKSLNEIAFWLNDKQIPTKRNGKAWTHSQVKSVLKTNGLI
jgi:DNA invertase Pin-like site-specific DNA recombinase